MSTIRTAITLFDGVTNPLRQMQQELGAVLNGFESMQTASGNAVDVSSIQQGREELEKTGATYDEVEDNIRDADKSQQKFNDSIEEGTSAAGDLWTQIKGIAAAIGGMTAIKKAIGLSDQLTSTNARLSLIVDDNGSVDELEKKIMASAERARASYFDTADAIASMGANAGAAFASNDELIAFMEQVNKQFVIGGASAQGQAAAMLQLTQAMSMGALRGQELNSILENAPGIARAIEQYLGAAEGSIKSYAEQGLITSEVVKNAMLEAADETNAKFETMPKTWSQIWTSMQNKALSIFEPILNKINEIANTAQFESAVNGILSALAGVATIATEVFDLLVNAASVVAENWSWLSPIILGVAAALAVYHGAQFLANTVESVSAGLQAAHAAATTVLTAAQNGLNAALAACPLSWILIMIIAIVAIFYAAVAAVNHFAGTSVSATGIICGIFATAFAFIANLFVALYNAAVEVFALIYNLIASVANFIATVFVDPVAAAANLFYDLADAVLGVLRTIASAIDAIFGSDLTGIINGWSDSLGSWVKDKYGEEVEVMSKIDPEAVKLDRFEYGESFDAGYKFGEGIEDKVGDLFSFDTSALDAYGSGMDNFDLGNTLDGIYGNTGDTAGNTAAMSDKLDVTEEDLAYLKDIAEREAINRFTTAEIRVEQSNNNYIDNSTDLDGIMNAWALDFAEKLNVSGEGVHA